MKQLYWTGLLSGLFFITDVSAILLDCEENSNGTYLCIRLDDAAEPSAIPRHESSSNENSQTYLERAKEHCEYREPFTRGGKTGNSGTRKIEAKKIARTEYDRCVINKAHELMNAEKNKDAKK